MMQLRDIAQALGGEAAGGQVLFPGPGHSRRDRSCTLRLSASAPDGFVVFGHAGDDWRVIRDFVRECLGGKNRENLRVQSTKMEEIDSDAERTRRALAIWSASQSPLATPVETYLPRRGVDLPREAVGEAIRFHPNCPFASSSTPAMVCLVRDILTNAPKAIHRTALSREGEKIEVCGHDRLSLGPIGGGAIKLTPDDDVTLCLGVGEGLETTLSLRGVEEFGGSPLWCLLNAGNLGALPVLPGIETLWVCVDNDRAGIKAADDTAQRWRAAAAEAFKVLPRKAGVDLNDLVTPA